MNGRKRFEKYCLSVIVYVPINFLKKVDGLYILSTDLTIM